MSKKSVKNKKIEKKSTVTKKSFLLNQPILHIAIKSLFLILIVGIVVYYSDSKGYFNPDETNNHTMKKWNAFYEFSEKNDVDIILLGNSHLYSGINPKNLSVTLGLNAFILASPGTNIANTYFSLKEALKRTNPKLIVIETYGINNFDPYKLKKGGLSDQFKSFYARRDFFIKTISTPFLFKSDNYCYAWSNTLRNHDFIFNDTLQLSKNQKIIKKKPKKNNKLYLGRYVRFQTGIEDTTLVKYDSLGSPVKGEDYLYSEYALKYVDKIVEVCKENNVELMFLTLPMYYKHIDNYAVWNKKISEVLKKYPNKWLNMQLPYDTTVFTPMCFENTYKNNQHMTYNGSLIATYKLAKYIKSELNVKLPSRKNNTKWKNIFYGQEGYFENNPVLANDEVNKLLCKDFATNNVFLKEVSIIQPQNSKNKIIIAKIENKNKDLSHCRLRLVVDYIENKQFKTAPIDLQYDILHQPNDMFIFKALITSVDIKNVKAGFIFCNNK